jgi:DNA-binding response OmpR family regulator
VDDCREAAAALGAALSVAGFKARVCRSGPDAEAALDEFRPDVCLIDLKTSGREGLDLARRVRAGAAGRPVPLVALAGLGDAETRELAAAAGFDAVVLKPVDPDQLAAVLADAVILRGGAA